MSDINALPTIYNQEGEIVYQALNEIPNKRKRTVVLRVALGGLFSTVFLFLVGWKSDFTIVGSMDCFDKEIVKISMSHQEDLPYFINGDQFFVADVKMPKGNLINLIFTYSNGEQHIQAINLSSLALVDKTYNLGAVSLCNGDKRLTRTRTTFAKVVTRHSGLNLRSSPEVYGGNVITRIPRGDVVEIKKQLPEQLYINNHKGQWYLVSYRGNVGYCFSYYLEYL